MSKLINQNYKISTSELQKTHYKFGQDSNSIIK